MSDDKAYSKRCPKCGEAFEHQWAVTIKEALVYALSDFDKDGHAQNEEVVDNQGSELVEYSCACGASFTKGRDWRALEVVEVEI